MWWASQIQLDPMSEFGWWAAFTLPNFKNFWGGIRYGPKPCEGRTDDRHYLSKTFIFFIWVETDSHIKHLISQITCLHHTNSSLTISSIFKNYVIHLHLPEQTLSMPIHSNSFAFCCFVCCFVLYYAQY